MNNFYPKSLFCIIATEFCERFSFCGLRTILSLYLRNELLVPENTATVIYHVFIMLCYLVPVMGAVVADGFFGRYRTILYFSVIYLLGNILMCFAAMPPFELSPLLATIFGLVLIAFGTGGIKPCVAAFGGDQFVLPEQKERLQRFFSVFYFAINTGGFLGMLITPTLRKSVMCFGNDTCYALGFGFPAVLMLFAILVFMCGKPWYKLKKPKENVLLKFITCTMHAIKNRLKLKKSARTKQHWLDYAEGKCDPKQIADMKVMYTIILMYAPLPLFWCLFDQQGSKWIFQASRTNGTISIGKWSMQMLPDQIQVVNPAIVLLLIPVLEHALYPNCGTLLRTPLRRMLAGGLAAGGAFLASAMLEFALEKTYPQVPEPGTAAVNFINTLHCPIHINLDTISVQLSPHEFYRMSNIPVTNWTEYTCTVSAPQFCDPIHLRHHQYHTHAIVQEQHVETVLVGVRDEGDVFLYVTEPVDYTKSLSGKPRVRVAYMHGANDLRNVTVTITMDEFQDVFFIADSPPNYFSLSQYMELAIGRYFFEVKSTLDTIHANGSMQLQLGGVYTLVIREFRDEIVFTELYTLSPPNSISMLWLLPQYFLISIGEIMFAISGLEFSFTQAPKSMQTIVIAAWYLTVALGNFLVILVTQVTFFRKQAHEFFMYTVLILIDMLIFWYITNGYEFTPLESDGSSLTQRESEPLLTSGYEPDVDSSAMTVSVKTVATS